MRTIQCDPQGQPQTIILPVGSFEITSSAAAEIRDRHNETVMLRFDAAETQTYQNSLEREVQCFAMAESVTVTIKETGEQQTAQESAAAGTKVEPMPDTIAETERKAFVTPDTKQIDVPGQNFQRSSLR